MSYSENVKIAPLLVSADINAGVDAKSVNMGGGHSATFVLLFGSGLTGDAKMTVYTGATAGAKTTAITDWIGRVASAAIGSPNADVYASSEVTVDTGQTYATLTGTTYAGKMLIVEIPARAVPADKPWVTLSFSADASAGSLEIVGLITPRYKSNAIATVLPTA